MGVWPAVRCWEVFPLYEDFVECVSDAELKLPVIASARIPLDVLYGEPEPGP